VRVTNSSSLLTRYAAAFHILEKINEFSFKILIITLAVSLSDLSVFHALIKEFIFSNAVEKSPYVFEIEILSKILSTILFSRASAKFFDFDSI
jgi:hypothetical protein